jgi:hypothetical protein
MHGLAVSWDGTEAVWWGNVADTGEQVWKINLTIGRVVNSTDIPSVPSRPGGACNDIAPYYGALPLTSMPELTLVTKLSHQTRQVHLLHLAT